jgi:hypothetical protein
MTKVNNLLAVAAVAVALTMSACGGDTKQSAKGYKEPFGFLENTRRAGSARGTEEMSYSLVEKSRLYKKEETAKQAETLNQMMAGANKKTATLFSKAFYEGGWVALSFEGVSIDNGAKIAPEFISLNVNIKEFPDAACPFEKYYVILDKNGNVARLQAVRTSYSWSLEPVRVQGLIRTHYLNSIQGDWPGDVSVPDKVLKSRTKFWEDGGTLETDFYSRKFSSTYADPALGY